jgi:Pheromone A receptor
MLSGIDMAITIPFNIWYCTTWAKVPLAPWPGWKFIHSNWSQVQLLTTVEWRSSPPLSYQVEITRWMNVVYGLIFFGLLGVTAEARKYYAFAWQRVSKTFRGQTQFSRKLSRYVLRFVSVFCELIQLRPRTPVHPHNVHISFDDNQHPASDKSDSSTLSYGIRESIITLSTTSDTESEFAPSSALTNLPRVPQQQCNIMCIPPFPTPPHLKSDGGAQPPVLDKLND